MSVFDELRDKLKERAGAFDVEVRASNDELLPPYHIALTFDNKVFAHVHATEPDPEHIFDELQKELNRFFRSDEGEYEADEPEPEADEFE